MAQDQQGEPWYGHRVLLAGVSITRSMRVWAAGISCIPMPAGCAYLVAALDVFRRRLLAWRLSNTMEARGVAISMDGRGRWIDVVSERFWRSRRYEHGYLHAYADLVSARAGIGAYISYYNGRRRHGSLGRRTPDAVFAGEGQGGSFFRAAHSKLRRSDARQCCLSKPKQFRATAHG